MFHITALHLDKIETVAKVGHLHLARHLFEESVRYWSDSDSIVILTDNDGEVLDASWKREA